MKIKGPIKSVIMSVNTEPTRPPAISISRFARNCVGCIILTLSVRQVYPATVSTIVIFFLIGIWHGITINALIFGLYFGLLMALSTLLDPLWKLMNRVLRLPKWIMTPFRLVRTWVLVIAAQYFAFTPSLEKAMLMLEKTFDAEAWVFDTFASRCTKIMSPLEWIIAGSALLIILVVDIICEHKKDFCDGLARTHFFIRWPLVILLILAILVFGCYGQGYDSAAFLYTQF